MISHASDPNVDPNAAPAVDLDQIMAAAYQLFLEGRYVAVDALCQRLIALDRSYWWCHSLRAVALATLGRFDDALDAVERGLCYERGNPKLLALRVQILAAIGASLVARRKGGADARVLKRRGYGR